MITLTKGSASERIYVTLSEKLTLADPVITFVFTHVTTKGAITFNVQLSNDDLSQYPLRYNEFAIATSTLFATSPLGQWHYTATESTGVLLESGRMQYLETTNTVFSGYGPATTYKGYEG